MCAKHSVCVSAQLCPTFCDPMDCSPPGSSVHGIFQARILEWVSISFSRGFSWPRDQTCVSCVSCIEGSFTSWDTREATKHSIAILFYCLLSHSVFSNADCNSLKLFHIPLIDYNPQFENHWSNPTCLFKHIVYSSSLFIYSSTHWNAASMSIIPMKPLILTFLLPVF